EILMENSVAGLPDQDIAEFLTYKYLDHFFRGVEADNHFIADQIHKHFALPKIASHLVTPRFGYTHHGLYIGNGQVIHYSGFGNEMRGGPVEQVDIQTFCNGENYEIQYHNHVRFTPEQIVDRAKSKLGESKYNLIFNNCEHFVNWCIDNLATSRQVNNAGRAVTKIAAKSNPVAHYGLALNDTKSAILAYLKGDIGKEKMFEEISSTAVNTASMSFYGALGQAAIPIPVAGFLVGSGIGLVIGNLLQQSGLLALGDSPVVQEAKQRREEINLLCQRLIPEIRRSRAELETYLEAHFKDRATELTDSFRSLDDSLKTMHTKGFTDSLERINNQFGAVLQFKSFEDFDSFMGSEQAFEF
ncbi:lecithin retinol acyltransferase family protein, partial [Marinobacter sp. VGCF2001]|uniref:lecithin retinol acyltransferase family protein n=1 Tax=Marinobacter sp. VGCF2001 TaxID=3417189 RepID=UPI003CECE263